MYELIDLLSFTDIENKLKKEWNSLHTIKSRIVAPCWKSIH